MPFFCALVAVAYLQGSAVPARQDRITFYRALTQVQRGWSKDQVKALLGPPDDVIGSSDPQVDWVHHSEIWRYGTDHHLGFPTLGQIAFDGTQAYAGVYPWPWANPAPLSLISQPELDQHLRNIWELAGDRGNAQDPLRLIRVANDLNSLPYRHPIGGELNRAYTPRGAPEPGRMTSPTA